MLRLPRRILLVEPRHEPAGVRCFDLDDCCFATWSHDVDIDALHVAVRNGGEETSLEEFRSHAVLASEIEVVLA